MKSLIALEKESGRYQLPSWEMFARYVAAYGCMLVALLAGWQSLNAPFAPILLMVLLTGLPISLYLRANGVRYKGKAVNRLALSSLVMALTVVLSMVFLVMNLASFGASFGGLLRALITFSASRSIELMMGVFLIFGACRCLFILSDKDALLCSLPSFAVLLLLLVVQREPIIVFEFLIWTVLTAILLALEHRRESRRSLSGYIAASVPGQDVKLSARSLATIMTISLVGAIGLSYTLAANNSSDRNAFEDFLRFVSSGINRVSRSASEADTNETDEMQASLIDYRASPPIPTRTILWRMYAQTFSESKNPRGRIISQTSKDVFPTYWRLSSLANYDGAAWTPEASVSALRPLVAKGFQRMYRTPFYVVAANAKRDGQPYYTARSSQVRLLQTVVPAFNSNGYVPVLPKPWRVFHRSDSTQARATSEGALIARQLQANTPLWIESVVSPWPEYSGSIRRNVKDDSTLRLAVADRKLYLQLPSTTPKRVLDVARLRAGKRTDSAATKARRLAKWVQGTARYTLRPPGLPDGDDAVDFFLFESRRGYCTHFAGALTVLCREIGIPARMVTGFANPELEKEAERGQPMLVARAANAHAWTEVWLDGKGWMPLDATPEDDRGDNSPTLWADLADRFSAAFTNLWLVIQTNKMLWAVGIAAAALLAVTTIVFGRRVRERSHWVGRARALFRRRNADKPDIEYSMRDQAEVQREADDIDTRAAIFNDWNRAQKSLSRHFEPRPEWQTPHNWVADAREKMTQFDLAPLQTLVDLQRRALYDPRFLGDEEKQIAHEALKSLSWKNPTKEKNRASIAAHKNGH